jgi:2,4-dichlorophenol 6-monooxygenase
MKEIQTPVLIAGGGGAGLTASMLLSTLGVDSLLVSALPSTSTLPKAHVLNQRTMEILRGVGVADRIYALGTPAAQMQATAWYAGFAGERANCGREIGRMEAWGAGGNNPAWAAASACRSANLPQIRLEPILRERAEELAPGRVHFGHELVEFAQSAGEVRAIVLERDTGEHYRVCARYLLACDGGRAVGPKLGIALEGQRNLVNEVSIHLSGDLSRWARDPEVLIRWIWLPDTGRLAVLVPMGPEHWGPDSEEWVFHLNYPADDPRAQGDARVEADMRGALGIGDHPVTIHKVSRWSLEGVLADRFRVGNAFVVGDAAHRHPPTGGLGLNCAIQDAHNLCWKIAAVLAGHASDRLLDSYEAERRPVARRNVDRSLESAANHFSIGRALGFDPEASADANWAAFERFWSGRPEHAAQRAEALRALASQSMEFDEHNVEYGYVYESDAIAGDGTPPPANVDDVRVYVPSTRPGHPLPHADVDDADGVRAPLMDLVVPGRFLLIAGESGGAWLEATEKIAVERRLPLDAVRIGHLEGDYRDPRSAWIRQREIGPHGAVLVRPDRFVAWRSLGAAPDPAAALERALAQVLAR